MDKTRPACESGRAPDTGLHSKAAAEPWRIPESRDRFFAPVTARDGGPRHGAGGTTESPGGRNLAGACATPSSC